MNRTWIFVAVALIIGGIGGFFIGQQTGGGGSTGPVTLAALKATPSDQVQQVIRQYFQANGGFGGPGGAGGFGNGSTAGGTGAANGNRARGGFVDGTVIAKDASSLTIKLPSGGTRNVIYSNSTTVTKSTTGALSDVANGANVMVTGSSSADGSVTATRIQILPEGQAARIPPGAGAPPTGTSTTSSGS